MMGSFTWADAVLTLDTETAQRRAAPLRTWSEHAFELGLGLAELLVFETDPTRLQALHLDAQLYPLGAGAHLPAYLQLHSAERAPMLALGLGIELRSDYVLANWSAAWVHLGLGAPPARQAVATPIRRRAREEVTLHQFYLRPEDVMQVGGCPVMVPGRCAAELLRSAPDCPKVARTVRALNQRGWTTKRDVLHFIHELGQGRNSRRAFAALEAIGVD